MFSNARKLRWALLAVAAFSTVAASSFADSPEEFVDADKQSDLLKRVFSYDKNLRRSERVVVIIVANARKGRPVDDVATVFREKGLFPAVVTASDLSDGLTATLTVDSTVLYVMPGVAYEAVRDFAEKKGYLSISGVRSLAEAGHVAVSVGHSDGKPEIVVNLPRLESERHELSSELLNLARVIR
jgi:hypothetical protein